MLKKFLPILFISLFMMPVFSGDWVAESDKDGIKIFTRTTEGSNVREFKGEVIVNANYKKINSVVDNIANLENWMSDVGTNYLVDTFNIQPNGSKELYLINITTAPLGVSYRYALIYSKIIVTDQKITRTMQLSQDSKLNPQAKRNLNNFYATLPIKKNGVVLKKSNLNEMVKYTELYGAWIFEKINDNQTKVTYTVKANPGGYVPVAVANATAKNNPYNTLKGLLSQLK